MFINVLHAHDFEPSVEINLALRIVLAGNHRGPVLLHGLISIDLGLVFAQRCPLRSLAAYLDMVFLLMTHERHHSGDHVARVGVEDIRILLLGILLDLDVGVVLLHLLLDGDRMIHLWLLGGNHGQRVLVLAQVVVLQDLLRNLPFLQSLSVDANALPHLALGSAQQLLLNVVFYRLLRLQDRHLLV